ncbi:hypothetical protein, partial [Mesorhizobium sp. M2E.F.Ca.ET.166.01.1.1]|uniref:hypothetical protein n=1 Tax=Mesorhizobium sp. M2E.F.Ca.ET.166.01.1.1 TaxID=2500523 RepID=UPI001AEE0D07
LIAPAGDADEGFMARHQRLGSGHDLCLPPLVAAMAGLGPLRDSGGAPGQMLLGMNNPMPTVALKSEQVVASPLCDDLSHARVTVERIGVDNSTNKM